MFKTTKTIPLGNNQQINLSGSFTLNFTRMSTEQGALTDVYELDILGATSSGVLGALQISDGSGGFLNFWNYDSSIDTVNSTGSMGFSTDGNLNLTQNTTGSGIGIDTSGYIGIGANGGGVTIAENTYGNKIQLINDGSIGIYSDNGGNLLLQNNVYNNQISVGGGGAITINSTNGQNVDITGYNEVNLTSNHADMTLTSNGNSMHLYADHEMTVKGGLDGEGVYMENVNHGNQFKLNGTGSCEVNSMNNGNIYLSPDGAGVAMVNGKFGTKIQNVTMTTSGTATADGSPNLMLHATGTIALYSVVFPASPIDGQLFTITTDQTITAFGSSGTSLRHGVPSTFTEFTPASWQYNGTLNYWFRV